jgi:hypothetical protein
MLEGRPNKEMLEKQQKRGISIENYKKHYRPGSYRDRMRKIQIKYFDGTGKCLVCHNFPLYKVIYKLDYGSVIEWYCEQHKHHIPT